MDILTILRDATIAGTRVSLKGDLLKIGELAYVPERGALCGARCDARVWRGRWQWQQRGSSVGSDSECGQ